MTFQNMKIALDGPAAAGSGTLAKGLTKHFDLKHTSAGNLYREMYLRLADAGWNITPGMNIKDPRLVESTCKHAALIDCQTYTKDRLHSNETGFLSSVTSPIPEAREIIRNQQKKMTGEFSRLIMEGRDITSVVMPDADTCIFLTADERTRAERRYQQVLGRSTLEQTQEQPNFEHVLNHIKERDVKDKVEGKIETRAA